MSDKALLTDARKLPEVGSEKDIRSEVETLLAKLAVLDYFRLSLLSLLTNTLPDPSASEVTTVRRYTNLFIIITIIIIIIISLMKFLK